MAAINIGTDSWDYSRYDPAYSTVHVYGAVDLAHQNQTCTVTLARNDVYGTLATHVIPNVGAIFSIDFDLNSSEMQDSDGVNRAVQGDYTVTATLADSTTTNLQITVSIISVRQIRDQWMYGITALSSEVVMPRQQPRLMPVKVTFTSPAFVKDAYDMVYRSGLAPSF